MASTEHSSIWKPGTTFNRQRTNNLQNVRNQVSLTKQLSQSSEDLQTT